MNDVIEVFFCDEFPPFLKHKKGHQHQQKIFTFIFTVLKF